MNYRVKEIFYSIQGEGHHAGRPATFCRFSGCNLWSGKEQDRHKAICKFCDTDFVGGDIYETAEELADAIAAFWKTKQHRFVVLTGGEPSMQVDYALLTALKERHFYIAIETNGTRETLTGVDWICVSPKAGTYIAQDCGDELKLVYPQNGIDPASYEGMRFHRFSLQPEYSDRERATAKAIAYCLEHPKWNVSLQTHKLMGVR